MQLGCNRDPATVDSICDVIVVDEPDPYLLMRRRFRYYDPSPIETTISGVGETTGAMVEPAIVVFSVPGDSLYIYSIDLFIVQ